MQTASLIPSALEGIPTGDEFIARLPEFDAQFDAIRKEAAQEGKVLRFVGVVDPTKGEVKAGSGEVSDDAPVCDEFGRGRTTLSCSTRRGIVLDR